MTDFPRPQGRPAFTYDWFVWFASRLTLPEGGPVVLEGHTLLILQEFFRDGLVHLLVLIPKGNGKTTIMAALAVWHLLTTRNANVYIGAADKIQAGEMYRFAAHFIESEPEIDARLRVLRGTREIKSRADEGFILVLASDDSKQGGKRQGFNPTLALIDELHAHENDKLYTDMRSGLFKRRGKMATITTAGFDPESTLAILRREFLGDPLRGQAPKGPVLRDMVVQSDGSVKVDADKGRLTIARFKSGRSVMLEWACRYDAKRPHDRRYSDDLSDMATVKLANPSSTVTIESLEDALESLTPWWFRRYRCNVWTLGGESWLPDGAWDKMYDPQLATTIHRTWEGATTTGQLVDPEGEFGHWPTTAEEPDPAFVEFVKSLYPEGSNIVSGIDMARYRDTAAVTSLARHPDTGRKIVRTIVWKSGGHDNPIQYEWVKCAVRLLHHFFVLNAAGRDPKYFDQAGEELADEGIEIEDFPQSNERIGPADTELRKEIIQGEFVHDGDPTLAAHVVAGKTQDIGPKVFKVVQQDGASPPPIDACKALSMANALEKDAEEKEPLGAWA